jgi:hypothetical protein
MDQDGSLFISYNEWRDFLMLAPSNNIHDLIKYWRHSTVSLSKKHIVCDTVKRMFVKESACVFGVEVPLAYNIVTS